MGDDDYVLLNRRCWDQDAENLVESGRERWAMDEPTWGWGHQESELHLFPEQDGLDAVELGCGTAFISSWLTRAGARVVGIDNSSSQLATAAKLQAEFHSDFPLVQANAEVLPFPDASFDFAISEFGAVTYCDPYRWVPEAARVLRPGGRLVACSLTAFAYVCFPLDDDEAPADMALHRDYFGMHRFEWRDASGEIDVVDFHIGYGDMIRLLRSSGFVIDDLIELRPNDGTSEGPPFTPWEWAQRWPSIEVWKATKA